MSRRNKPVRAAEAAIQALYDSLPTLECQGHCQDSCGLSNDCVADYERTRIARYLGHDPGFLELAILPVDSGVDLPDCLSCPLLKGGACSVYPIRPLICRLWGMVDDPLMTCPYGCRPSRYLSNEEVRVLWRKLETISLRHSHDKSHLMG